MIPGRACVNVSRKTSMFQGCFQVVYKCCTNYGTEGYRFEPCGVYLEKCCEQKSYGEGIDEKPYPFLIPGELVSLLALTCRFLAGIPSNGTDPASLSFLSVASSFGYNYSFP